MKLTIHEDGFGYTAEGVRYWRDWQGRWLRVIRTDSVIDFTSTSGWVSGTNAVRGRVMLHYTGEDYVYEMAS